MTILGIVFLRQVANRYDASTKQNEADKDAGLMPKRAVIGIEEFRKRYSNAAATSSELGR